MQPLQPINILAKIFTNAGIGITIDNIFYAFISNNNDKQQMKKNDFNIILQVENEKQTTQQGYTEKTGDVYTQNINGNTVSLQDAIIRKKYFTTIRISVVSYKTDQIVNGVVINRDFLAKTVLDKICLCFDFANVKKEFIDAKLTLIKRPYNISDISEIESTDTQTIDRYDFLVDLLVEKSIEYTNEIIDEFVSDKIKII